jgi:hypothetical protein
LFWAYRIIIFVAEELAILEILKQLRLCEEKEPRA